MDSVRSDDCKSCPGPLLPFYRAEDYEIAKISPIHYNSWCTCAAERPILTQHQLTAVRGSLGALKRPVSFISSEPSEFSLHALIGIHFVADDRIPARHLCCFLKRQGF